MLPDSLQTCAASVAPQTIEIPFHLRYQPVWTEAHPGHVPIHLPGPSVYLSSSAAAVHPLDILACHPFDPRCPLTLVHLGSNTTLETFAVPVGSAQDAGRIAVLTSVCVLCSAVYIVHVILQVYRRMPLPASKKKKKQ